MSEPSANSIQTNSSKRSILQANNWLSTTEDEEDVDTAIASSSSRPPTRELSPDFGGCVCCECNEQCVTQWELLRHVRKAHPGADVAYCCWHCTRQSRLELDQGPPRVAGAAASRSLGRPARQGVYGESVDPRGQEEQGCVIYAVTRRRPLNN